MFKRQNLPLIRQIFIALTAALTASAAFAASLLEGTWGGANARGESAQVIVTGNEVIGFYWRDDYVEAGHAKFSQGGAQLDFTFAHGTATLKRTKLGATLTIQETGKGATQLDLKKD